tara:strand:- start:4 stop:132 length:129 start_codon:yes stop_codon:yes gene_type:complete
MRNFTLSFFLLFIALPAAGDKLSKKTFLMCAVNSKKSLPVTN